ncbi:MAG: SWIM zinc finger domain-containing protein [Phycisphaeraceae bacterium JB051]
MPEAWTEQRVIALAPDAASVKAAQSQANAAKWPMLGRDDNALWGEVKGSGKKPYQVRIDLTEPAFKCSCPSRKFPCKHALGLLLILARQPDAIAIGEPPQWVIEWLESRQQRAEKKQASDQAKASKPVDEKAQAKRIASREKKVQTGIAELRRFLRDVIRQGLADAQTKPFGFWEQMAARMVDAQAPGLARRVRTLSQTVNDGQHWQSRLLRQIARLHLLLEGYTQLENQPVNMQAELRSQVGWTQSREALQDKQSVSGLWCVIGQQVEQEDKLKTQWTWLSKLDDGAIALILNFAAGNQPLDISLPIGSCFEGHLAYYDGSLPFRAIITERSDTLKPISQLHGYASLTQAMQGYAHALASCPWIDLWPMVLEAVQLIPRRIEKTTTVRWSLRDAVDLELPLPQTFTRGWDVLGITSGQPFTMTGLWDGQQFEPFGILSQNLYRTWQRHGSRQVLIGGA